MKFLKKKRILILGLSILLVCGTLIGCGQKQQSTAKNDTDKKTLLIYCAAGVNKPMEEIAKEFTYNILICKFKVSEVVWHIRK